MPKKRYTKQEIEQIIADWETSTQSISKYASENGYPFSTFYRWTTIYKKGTPKTQSNRFVEIPKMQVAESSEKQTILIEKAGIKITVPLNVEHETLQKIMNIVENCK